MTGSLGIIFLVSFSVFVVFYLQSSRLLRFFEERTFGVQTEILEIMDKLLISQNKKKIRRNIWIFTLAISLVAFLAFWPNILMSLISFVVIFVLSWHALKIFFKSLWEKHCNTVVDDMAEALGIMKNSLKVGLSLGQAMERVIRGGKGPLVKELKLVLNKMQIGQSMEEAFEDMAERVKRREVDMLVSVINILKETGGNLAETFTVMTETLVERQKMEKKIRALTAQGIMQARIISSLPFLLILVFYFMDRNYISPLLFTPLGWVCLAATFGLVAVGAYAMKKMVEIKI